MTFSPAKPFFLFVAFALPVYQFPFLVLSYSHAALIRRKQRLSGMLFDFFPPMAKSFR